MANCDICNRVGMGTIVKASDMSAAVSKGFDPFKLGLASQAMMISDAFGLGPNTYPAMWRISAISGPLSKTDWNICDHCMVKLRPYLEKSTTVKKKELISTKKTSEPDKEKKVKSKPAAIPAKEIKPEEKKSQPAKKESAPPDKEKLTPGAEKAAESQEKKEIDQSPPVIKSVNKRDSNITQKIWLMLANFNLTGLGFWLSDQKIHGYIFVGAGLFLLVVGHLLNASKNPLVWAFLFLAMAVGMVVDLWILMRDKEIKLPNFIQKSPTLLPVLVVLVNVIFYGGFLLYRSSGQKLYENGLKAYQEGDFSSAFGNWYSLSQNYRLSLNKEVSDIKDQLQEVALLVTIDAQIDDADFVGAFTSMRQFRVLFPESTLISSMADMGMDAYLAWAEQLDEQNDFDEGLEKLTKIASHYPIQMEARQREMDAHFSAHYLAWGDYLFTQADFAGAVEKYEYLLAVYPDLDEAEQAYEQAALSYLEWSDQLNEQQQYEDAALKLEQVVENYADSTALADSMERLPEAYLAWGGELSEQQQYLLALEKYSVIKDLDTDAALKEDAEEQYQSTLLLLAYDTGTDGSAVLAEAKEQACDGEIPTNPSVGILEDEPPKVQSCSINRMASYPAWLSTDLTAASPGEFRYVIMGDGDSRVVQTCAYDGGYKLERRQIFNDISIVDILTGEVIAERTFYGPAPESCPFIYIFHSTTDWLVGDRVDEDTVNEWIEQELQ